MKKCYKTSKSVTKIYKGGASIPLSEIFRELEKISAKIFTFLTLEIIDKARQQKSCVVGFNENVEPAQKFANQKVTKNLVTSFGFTVLYLFKQTTNI